MNPNETAVPAFETFGAAVRRLRQEKQIGLRELARRVGISPTYLTQIEKDACPVPEERATAIARALDQDVDELLAMAGRVASDVGDYIRSNPRAVASFLRLARDRKLSEKDFESLTQIIGRMSA